jgi:hypothetical protein
VSDPGAGGPAQIAHRDHNLCSTSGEQSQASPERVHRLSPALTLSAEMRRMANLLQISSAPGRAMETVDRTAMCRALSPVLCARRSDGVAHRTLRDVVAASAEVVWQARCEDRPAGTLDAALDAGAERAGGA